MRCFVMVLLLISTSAQASEIDSFRCGNYLIEVGMNTSELIAVCGSRWMPDEIRTTVKHYTSPRSIKHL